MLDFSFLQGVVLYSCFFSLSMITINWTPIGLNWTILFKCFEMIFVVIWCYINKIELNCNNIIYLWGLTRVLCNWTTLNWKNGRGTGKGNSCLTFSQLWCSSWSLTLPGTHAEVSLGKTERKIAGETFNKCLCEQMNGACSAEVLWLVK